MNPNLVRMAGAAILVYLAMSGKMPGGVVVPSSGPYTGPLTALHSAAGSMEPHDRLVLGEALEAAGEMLDADKLGIVATTEELQRYIKACTEFEYQGLGKPTKKYPEVAKAIQAELSKAIGSDVAPVTSSMRRDVSAALVEAGKAIR
jgi:hypothetical protein